MARKITIAKTVGTKAGAFVPESGYSWRADELRKLGITCTNGATRTKGQAAQARLKVREAMRLVQQGEMEVSNPVAYGEFVTLAALVGLTGAMGRVVVSKV